MSCRRVSNHYITLNDTTHLAVLCMSTGTKGGLAKTGHSLMDYDRLLLTKNKPTSISQDVCQMAKTLE